MSIAFGAMEVMQGGADTTHFALSLLLSRWRMLLSRWGILAFGFDDALAGAEEGTVESSAFCWITESMGEATSPISIMGIRRRVLALGGVSMDFFCSCSREFK